MKAVQEKKRVLKVIHRTTREVVGEIDVHDRSQAQVEKIMLGMLRSMSDEFYIDDSEI